MKLGRSFSLACILILFARPGKAQELDSTILYTSTSTEMLVGQKHSTQRTDTAIDNTQNYHPFSVLGNIGLPSYSLLAQEYASSPTFFRWMSLNNSNDLFTEDGPLYFQPSGKVNTRLFGAMGQKQEQVFKFRHSQNINRVNISLLFNRYSCFGFYPNQKTITDNLLLSSHYKTKNGRWGYRTHILYNKLKYQLNGGIQSDAQLDTFLLKDKALIPINLSTARQNLKTFTAGLSSFFRLNKNDSDAVSHFLVYEGSYQSNYWFYSAGYSDTAYYAHTYFYNNVGVYDSVSFQSVSNSVLYKLSAREDKFTFYAGYKNELSQYRQFSIDTLARNNIARAGLATQWKKQSLLADMKYVISGYNKNNYTADARYNLSLLSWLYVNVKASASRTMPFFNTQQYFSPHFVWNNNFTDISTQNGTITLGSYKYKFSIGAFYQSQQNQVYFDTMALSRQYNGSTSLMRVFVQKDLKLGPVHFNNTIHYQTTSNPDIIRLPSLFAFSQLYFEKKLFKKRLWMQAGLQARYMSAWKANAYMPATNQFYLQDKKEYGNYPFIDLFISAQIVNFRFFLMAQHINQGLSGSNYILCPGYPMPDRSLKAGLVWLFFD
jgi:hypothetical protein